MKKKSLSLTSLAPFIHGNKKDDSVKTTTTTKKERTKVSSLTLTTTSSSDTSLASIGSTSPISSSASDSPHIVTTPTKTYPKQILIKSSSDGGGSTSNLSLKESTSQTTKSDALTMMSNSSPSLHLKTTTTKLNLAALCKQEAIDALIRSPRYEKVYVVYKDGVLHRLQALYENTQMITTRYCYICTGKICSNNKLSIEREITGERKTDLQQVTFPVYRQIVIGGECLDYIIKEKEDRANLVVQIELSCFELYETCKS